jgi:4'-phosphopantetheinyl transferase
VRQVVSSPASEWLASPASTAIENDEVHVWKVDLSATVREVRLLSRDEHERAARFHFERDRQHFKASRSALRMILGRYLNLPPESLEFAQTEYGKPFLTNLAAAGVLFNLSHSGEVALIAVAREREVGVDVEFMRADFATNEVAEHFFSVAEIYTLSGLEPHLRTQAFFNCWTRKEAYVKARGEGLSMPLDVFDVTLAPNVPAAMLNNRVDTSEPARWIFQNLHIAPDYAGALVIEALRSQPRLSHFQFDLPSPSGSGSG